VSEPGEVRPRWLRRLIGFAVLALAAGVLSSPWWVPRALSNLAYFQVRSVEVQGIEYASSVDLVETMGIDTTRSVWDDLGPIVRRLEAHPQVRNAVVGRRLPGTLVVRITEEPPVALLAGSTGLEPVDASGVVLPLDPSRVPTDLPIVSAADTALLEQLASVRRDDPAMFHEISDIRRTAADDLLVQFASVRLRTNVEGITARRLADALLVKEDLAQRGREPLELDLRFRHQIIARMP
jgi:cell division protein FtsQ